MALGPSPGAANNLLGGILALIAALPPEGLELVAKLVSAIANSKDPLRAVRLAAIVVASKKASTMAIEKLIGK